MSDIGFLQNWTNLFFINITPGAGKKTWARLAAGINSVDPNGNEVVSQDPYYDGEGVSSSDVTGGQNIVTFAGHRRLDDPAQNYIAGLRYDYGDARKTDYLQIEPDGSRTEANITLANIKAHGGAPNDKGEFSVEAHFNGRPSFEKGNKAEFPESITCEAISISDSTPKQIEATVTPEDASNSMVYAVEDPTVAVVDAQGLITPLKDGETNVNIKSAVLPTVQTTVRVTVTGVSEQNSVMKASAKSVAK